MGKTKNNNLPKNVGKSKTILLIQVLISVHITCSHLALSVGMEKRGSESVCLILQLCPHLFSFPANFSESHATKWSQSYAQVPFLLQG